MVMIVISCIFLVLILICLLGSLLEKEFAYGVAISGGLLIPWFLIWAVGSALVDSANYPYTYVHYGEPQKFSEVSRYDGNYIFEFDDKNTVVYDETKVEIAPPQDKSSIRKGKAYKSWGHWLPFNDWEVGNYIEYTPSND